MTYQGASDFDELEQAAQSEFDLMPCQEALNLFSFDKISFYEWLRSHKSEMIVPWIDGEACRFKTQNGFGLIFQNKQGDLTRANREAILALTCYARDLVWSDRPLESHRIKSKPLTKQQKNDIVDLHLAKYGPFCGYGVECQGRVLSRKEMTCDHLVPFSVGRSNDLRNFIVACPQCNRAMGDKFPADKVLMSIISGSYRLGGFKRKPDHTEIDELRDNPDWKKYWRKILRHDISEALLNPQKKKV